MKRVFFLLFLICTFTSLTAQNRIQYNSQDLFLSGANLAWISFANDIGKGTTNLDEFADILLQIHESGGNSLRWWLHTNGTTTPEFGAEDSVIGPGEYTISDIKAVLDLAWEREVGVKLCLWSFDMLRSSLSTNVKDRNILLLTDTIYTKAYINKALIPMVDSLKGHPAIIAWEIFNEPEGMSDEFGWSEILHIPMEDIQRFINLTSGAIHRTDTLAQVTSGCWSIQAMTDVLTGSLSKRNKEFTESEIDQIRDFINKKYRFSLSNEQVKDQLDKISLAANYNYYSDERLIAAGGDEDGFLDFYSVHYYDWAGTSLSPFHNSNDYWQLDKALVIAEFHMKNTLGVAKENLYKTLYDRGYAGALGWSWTDNAVTQPVDMLAGMQYLWNNHQADVDLLGIGGEWPTISIVSPLDGSKYSDSSDVEIIIEANDSDGSVALVEIIVNDTLKIAELTTEPYNFMWENVDPGNYLIYAIATDNEHHTRKSNIVSIIYGNPPFKRFEAEAVTIPTTGLTILSDATASNGAYAEMRDTKSKIIWRINNYLSEGNYELIFGYRLSFDTPKGQFINVNGSRVTELMFDGATNQWLEKSLFVYLIEGENIIEIEPSWGWMDLDYLAVPSDVVTGIETKEKIVNNFELFQNYPNPFNPNTTIRYSIPAEVKSEKSKVKNVILKVYDILGREVATLVNQKQIPGNYSVQFDGNSLSSGVYIYSLQTGENIQHRKMLLLK